MTRKVYVVTMWPEDGIDRAFGPDEPDIDDALLVFLTPEAAEEYKQEYLPLIGVYVVPIEAEIAGEPIPDDRSA